jgi:uncharacterized C2H2 Zn-finger protein
MLPNLTDQQQMLYQMLQLQQLQMIQTANSKQLPTDLMSLYHSWILSANMQQLNPFLSLSQQQSIIAQQQQQQQQISTPIPIPTQQFFQQQQQQFPVKTIINNNQIPTTPSPSISPNNDNKRKALTISELLESIPPLKKTCTTPLTSTTPSSSTATSTACSPFLITNCCLPTSSAAIIPTTAAVSFVSDNINNNDTPAASITSRRSESGSISDTEHDEFIDVVGDPVPKTKAQRKAHIEFYRKMKLLRNRENKLQCALCSEIVKNVESNVRTHIASHADSSMLICKICCYSSGDLHQMFEHMGTAHPKSRTSYEDRRNMTQLSELLSTCFPRGGVTKQRTGFIDSVQKVINISKKRNETFINCAVCQKDIQATKEILTRHMNLHHVYRCKKCKSIFHDEEEMQGHCQNLHEIESPKSAIDYHITAAADAVGNVFKKCFEKYLKDL